MSCFSQQEDQPRYDEQSTLNNLRVGDVLPSQFRKYIYYSSNTNSLTTYLYEFRDFTKAYKNYYFTVDSSFVIHKLQCKGTDFLVREQP